VLPLLLDRVVLGAIAWSFSSRDRASFTAWSKYACELSRRPAARRSLAAGWPTNPTHRLRKSVAVLESDVGVTAALVEVAHLSVPLLGGWCAIDVLDARGRMIRVAAAHVGASSDSALSLLPGGPRADQRMLPGPLLEGKSLVRRVVDEAYRGTPLLRSDIREFACA